MTALHWLHNSLNLTYQALFFLKQVLTAFKLHLKCSRARVSHLLIRMGGYWITKSLAAIAPDDYAGHISKNWSNKRRMFAENRERKWAVLLLFLIQVFEIWVNWSFNWAWVRSSLVCIVLIPQGLELRPVLTRIEHTHTHSTSTSLQHSNMVWNPQCVCLHLSVFLPFPFFLPLLRCLREHDRLRQTEKC